MSFEEHSDSFIWRCNGKGREKEVIFKPHDFFGCVAELKARGWSFVLSEDSGYEGSGRTWAHYCGHCDYKRKQTSIFDRPLREVK
jgi:hypothetical protein